ncbi:MAG: trypsin-like peptidase domain-containing protein [Candidatus Dormibacteraeota bacterium]|nr:trypsin-like peptidase domain-containing protein [Candidatus Dormibacteraeota bacterium]
MAAACSSTSPATSPSGATRPTPTTAPDSNTGGIASLQGAYVAVVKKVLPSVVQIETSSGLGSGIVYDSKGDIVTNNHVVSGATSFTVTTSSAKKYQGTLVGTFPADDLAVIHVSDASLTPASFADSSKLEVGDIVMAIGNPLGLQSSVTAGIVSATGRTVSEDNGVVLPDTIQTSAEINPGNSGGALVDLNGSVVGIPTLAAVDQQLGGSAPGIGFAIPSNIVTSIAAQLIGSGHVAHSGRAYLGVRIVVAAFGGNGALISSVDSGSPAAAAGLQAGDTITAINGKTVATPDDLSQALAQLAPGDKAQVALLGQDGSQRTVTVTLGELPG